MKCGCLPGAAIASASSVAVVGFNPPVALPLDWRRVLICLTRHHDTFADASRRIKERSARRMPQHDHCMRAVALIREKGNLPRKSENGLISSRILRFHLTY